MLVVRVRALVVAMVMTIFASIMVATIDVVVVTLHEKRKKKKGLYQWF